MIRSIFVLGILLGVSQRSFVSTVPISGGTLSMMRTQTDLYRDLNGKKEAHSMDTEEVKQNGQLVAKLFQRMDTDPEAPDKGGQPRARVRIELEVPSKGLHHVAEQQLPENRPKLSERKRQSSNQDQARETQNNVERSDNSPDGTQQYTPLDMAEYVFWTGDEKSVSLAIEEFLQEGVMNREEAILFLQEIKHDLDYLKNHYSRYDPNFKEQNQSSLKERNQPEGYQTGKPESQQKRTASDRIRAELNQLRQLQEVYKKRNADRKTTTLYYGGSNQGKNSGTDLESSNNEEYQELMERLRLADFLYTEYSLEEVIYQLAKVIFTQSLTAGSADAQNALTKFINFLEKEAEEARISRALEKKVLDVLIAALSDTFNEHPELLNMRREMLQNNDQIAGQQVLRQLLEFPLEERNELPRATHLDFQKGKNIEQDVDSQIKDQKMLLHNLPYAIGRK
ncbi:uncharacterized protein LOC123319349 isoform X2 [Coccinella septempunctata]|uniref:uncharacterized protein LOC123319349 isoform X2 n=1 Tax=Coccinella septempunctata TaxID=41139 RepID=UPI001D064489|nr:uncharacterized protein LOC123319349 isoform X2 [Coccinella septempunctata]